MKNLTSLAAKVIRRLAGERTEANAIFNLATQFGGCKTHSLAVPCEAHREEKGNGSVLG